MSEHAPRRLSLPVRQIVELLVAKDYDRVARMTCGQRLDSESISQAIRDYGRTLVVPPDAAFEHLDVVRVRDARPPRWSVRMNLWTAEEQQSDLSIELTLIEAGADYAIELDDIHVL
jgi:hypothetical protein